MPENARMKMFGASPSEVRQARNQQRQAASTEWANLKPWSGMVKAAANAGGAFGDVLGSAVGAQDPAMQEALQVEEVKREVMGLGLDFNDPEQRKTYLSKVEQAFLERGLLDRAETVRQMAIAEEHAERNLRVAELEAGAREVSAKASMTSAEASMTSAEAARITAERGTTSTSNYQTWYDPNDPDGKEYRIQDGSQEMKDAIAKGFKIKQKLTTEQALTQVLTGLEGGRIEAAEKMAQLDAEAAGNKARAEAGAKADIEAEAAIFAKANKVREQGSALRSISNELTAMNEQQEGTQFGSLAPLRADVSRFFSTLFPDRPDLISAVDDAVKMKSTSFDTIERASAQLQTLLAAELADDGTRVSKYLLETLEKAGTSILLTNDGLELFVRMMQKRNQFHLDAEQFVLNLPGDSKDSRREIQRWKARHMLDEKYQMTAEDRVDLAKLQRAEKRVKQLYKESVPVPMAVDRDTGMMVVDNTALGMLLSNNPGTIFRHGGEFWLNGKDGRPEKVDIHGK